MPIELPKIQRLLGIEVNKSGNPWGALALLSQANAKLHKVVPSFTELIMVTQRFSGAARVGVLEFLHERGRRVTFLSSGGRFRGTTNYSPRLRRMVAMGTLDVSEESALYVVDGMPVLARMDGWGQQDTNGVILMFPRGTFSTDFFPQAALDAYPHRQASASRFQVLEVGSDWEASYGGARADVPKGTSYSYSYGDPQPPTDIDYFSSQTRYERGVSSEDMRTPDPCESVADLALTPSAQRAVDFVRGWFRARADYEQRRLVWRCGLLFEGPPGTGKTALARALACEMGVPLWVLNLASLSSRGFDAAWKHIAQKAPCVVFFDDFDRVYNRGELVGEEGPSFNTILQALGGVSEVSGLVTILAVNDVRKVDPTIFDEESDSPYGRRVSVRATFELPTAAQRAQIADRLLPDRTQEERAALVLAGEGDSGKQFVERCSATIVAKILAGLGQLP